ncbi:phosphotransferase [Zavarzinia aquatilis]|uniref:Hydroxylysine kinase n=1 Tax=Zavarzinia aquatilis TaxID=2211142 RepID=A0A317E2S9_9PROT|nr:phosphotransferase [Zavarzinia aquatilis]PWR21398.1 serine kinase [Zavarzinia aquatilis]
MPADVLTLAAPAVSVESAARLIREHYGLTGRIEAIPGERDRNFRLTDDRGRGFVLKMANPAEAPAITRLQGAALLHLAARDHGLPLPRVVPTLDGRSDFVHGETAMLTRLLTYLDGVSLHASALSPLQSARLGALLGRIDRALADFRHEAMERQLLWDATRVGQVRGLLNSIEDAADRALVARTIDHFEDRTAPIVHALPRQLIHNDLNPHNVVTRQGDPDTIAGIIDFGDALSAPAVADLGTALAYQMDEGEAPLARVLAFARAYHAERPLTEAEIGVLPDLMAARMVLTIAITHWRAGLQPENRAYILRNNPGAWAGLRRLSGFAPGAVGALFGSALQGETR